MFSFVLYLWQLNIYSMYNSVFSFKHFWDPLLKDVVILVYPIKGQHPVIIMNKFLYLENESFSDSERANK